jgi:hypothetical protein
MNKQTVRERLVEILDDTDAYPEHIDAILTTISEAVGKLETKKYFIQRINGISEHEEYVRLSDIQSLLKDK